MTGRERFIKTLKCEPIGGQVPTFELVFCLTMEAFGKIHTHQRLYSMWDQMSKKERRLHIDDIAQLYVDIARRYDHSAIFVHHTPALIGELENMTLLLELIREKSGDDYFLMLNGDPTWAVPDGSNMVEFASAMYEEPEKLNEESKRKMDHFLEYSAKINSNGKLLDGFVLCSDYCLNANPFFGPEMFDELIAPYLKGVIDGYREQGYYTIKHTDGNILPIVRQIADCGPDAIHSIDPQGGVSIPAVRQLIGDEIALIGNVNCGLLQTGTDEECRADVLRSLREGMERGRGYVFSTSNSIYTGMPLERYEMMIDLWRQYGNYDNYRKNFGA